MLSGLDGLTTQSVRRNARRLPTSSRQSQLQVVPTRASMASFHARLGRQEGRVDGAEQGLAFQLDAGVDRGRWLAQVGQQHILGNAHQPIHSSRAATCQAAALKPPARRASQPPASGSGSAAAPRARGHRPAHDGSRAGAATARRVAHRPPPPVRLHRAPPASR